ncbi:MAG: class II fructose-bisphosphatase [Alphaproteobacteria bacterium]|nr:class II fructose-bisphosphatase [Alphaproteobacteria bacterium]
MPTKTATTKTEKKISRMLTLEVTRVTERAAVACAPLIGRGDEKAADQAAVDAMRRELNRLDIDGRVVIGEGERDEAPMLYIGEEVGTGKGPKVDIALDPLEGTTLTAKGMNNALTVIAVAERGTLLNAPDTYMQKIAIGAGYPQGIVDLDVSPSENLRALAKAKKVDVSQINVCILDRPRHADLIAEIRQAGGRVTLIIDGDIAGVMHTTNPQTGIDMYMGIGGAPEGVLAAAALAATGGQMQGRLVSDDEAQKERARKMGIADFDHKYEAHEMAGGDVILSVTGVTNGTLVKGVEWEGEAVWTDTMLLRSATGTIRWLRSRHASIDKFNPD